MTLPSELDQFLASHDISCHTIKTIKSDVTKFIRWFTSANNEPFDLRRVTVRDVADFREHLTHVRRQSVATVNKAIVLIRRFPGHLVKCGALPANPAACFRRWCDEVYGSSSRKLTSVQRCSA